MFYKPIVCALILGVLILGAAIYYAYFIRIIQKKGSRSIGKILQHQADSDGYKIPVITFATSQGQEFQGKPFFYVATDISRFRSYKNKINKEVIVIYHPKDPKKFIIYKEKGFNYAGIVLMMLAGSVFCAVSIANLLGYITVNT